MSESSRLNFPYIVSSHILDALVQPSVEDALLSTPPEGSRAGELYVIGPSPTGVWSGKENCLAQYIGETWAFYVPFEGLTIWNKNTKKQWCYNGTQWRETKAEQHMTRTDNPHSVTAVQVGAETPTGAQAKVDTHVNTATGAHSANAISVTATGNISSTNVQAALAELDTEKLAATDVVSTAAANKVLRLNGSSKLPASITGDADTVDGVHLSGLMQTSHAANSITTLGGTSQALGAASNGSGTVVALANHVHPTTGLMTTAHVANAITGFGGNGTATTVSRSDHSHAAGTATDADTVDGKHATDLVLKAESMTAGALYRYQNLAAITQDVATVTGTLKITLPVSWSSTMISIRLVGYDYSGSGAWEVLLSGYNYGGGYWVNTSAQVNSQYCPFGSVRFAHDGTKCCILVGTTTAVWNYPRLALAEVIASFGSSQANFGSGWGLSFISSEAGITASSTPSLRANALRSEIPSTLPANGGNADTVDGLHAASFMQITHAANSITGLGTSGTATTIARSDHDHSSISGNSATATRLQTIRKINGVNFDGTADITIYAVYAP